MKCEHRFDGKVDAVGASDSAPVTDAELEEAHRLIKDHLNMRFGTFHKAFLTLDEDHSGSLTVLEFARVLMVFNLTQVREKVLARLAHLADLDEDGYVAFDEFSKLIMANHANELLKLHRVKPANPRPRTPRRATTPRGSGRPSGQVAARPARAASARAPKTTKAAAADHYVPMDHALEMWREGYAMGDGHRGNVDGLLTGYRFDGKVDEVGHDDDAEVQPAELEAAHKLIRSHLATRFSTFRRAFLMLDQDGDGKLSTLEMMRALMMLHLTNVREKVIKRLAFIADTDGDGYVEFHELCELMMAENALPLLKRHHHS